MENKEKLNKLKKIREQLSELIDITRNKEKWHKMLLVSCGYLDNSISNLEKEIKQ